MPAPFRLILNPAAYSVAGSQQDGQTASRLIAVSPVTQPNPQHGPDNEQLFQTGAYPERNDGPQWSIEQGFGKPPGFRWAHMPKPEQFSDDSILGIGWHDGADSLPATRAERQGWALPGPGGGPTYYYGQNPRGHFIGPEPIVIADAARMPYQELSEVKA